MLVTVITASFNSKATILACLNSLSRQEGADIEHVLVDGASSDETLDVVRHAGRPVDRLISEPDHGIYDALNKGITVSTGDVVGFLHSDDRFAADDVLNEVVSVFEETGCDAVYGDLEYVARNDNGEVIRYWRGKPYHPTLLRWGWMPAHPTLFMRRSVYERLGGFDLSYGIAGDYEAILRYFRSGLRAVYLPKVLVSMRMGGASNGSLKGIIRKMGEDYAAIRKHEVGGVGTLACKNLRKLSQFWGRVG